MNRESVSVLGVAIDRVTEAQAVEIVLGWLSEKRETRNEKRVVVTPNIEFIIKAQEDPQFKELLNRADLHIPDSSRIGWLLQQQSERDPLKRIVQWLRFPLSSKGQFPVVTGTDLIPRLCGKLAEKGFAIGLIGGCDLVAEEAAECLKKRYPGLKVSFAISDISVNEQGVILEPRSSILDLPSCDVLFVALGQGKQERFIDTHREQIPATVFVGVGGAFDYISGRVSRAPVWMRGVGLEWLYRLIMQPGRIKRQLRIVVFIFKLLFKKY